MLHPRQAAIGLVRMGESDFLPANVEDDLRCKDVYDAQGQRMGSVEDLYIDRQEREVRFLEVGVGGFLGISGDDAGRRSYTDAAFSFDHRPFQ